MCIDEDDQLTQKKESPITVHAHQCGLDLKRRKEVAVLSIRFEAATSPGQKIHALRARAAESVNVNTAIRAAKMTHESGE